MTVRSFTGAQYAALGMQAPETGPFALEVRAPWDGGGRGNYYASRGCTILGIVVHITAGLESLRPGIADRSAEGVSAWGATTTNQASWPVAVDTDSIVNGLHPNRVAWLHGVPGYNFNRPLWGMEICKLHANWWTMPAWWITATLRNAAIACAPIVRRYGIPLRVMTDRDEIQRLINAGRVVGFTEHWRLTPGTRQDAGRVGNSTSFPWGQFFGYVRDALAALDAGTSGPDPAVATMQRLLLEHGADLGADGADGRYGPITLTAAKAVANATGYTGRDVQNVAAFTTHLEEHMSQMLEAIAALNTKLDHVIAEQDRMHGRVRKQGGQLDKIDNWTPKVTADTVVATLLAYPLYGRPFHWWLRNGAINDPAHRNFPADPGSPADMEYRALAASGTPVRPYMAGHVFTAEQEAKLDARYPVAEFVTGVLEDGEDGEESVAALAATALR